MRFCPKVDPPVDPPVGCRVRSLQKRLKPATGIEKMRAEHRKEKKSSTVEKRNIAEKRN